MTHFYPPPMEEDDLASAGADYFLSVDPGPEQRGYVPRGVPAVTTPPTVSKKEALPSPESLTTAQLAAYSAEYLRRVRELLAGVERIR